MDNNNVTAPVIWSIDFLLAMLCSMWTDISPRKIQFYASEGSGSCELELAALSSM